MFATLAARALVGVAVTSAVTMTGARFLGWKPLQLSMPRMTSEQLRNVRAIVAEAKAAGMSDAEVAAMIVNAKAESNWQAQAAGDGGHSLGLFQLSDTTFGHLSKAQRFDPAQNTRAILEVEVLADNGKRFRRSADLGSSVAVLAGIFAEDIERCRDCKGREKLHREQMAVDLFGPHARRSGWLVSLPPELEVT